MADGGGSSGGIGFLGALTIAFIVLRLCGVIDWPWAMVLAPVLVPIAIALVVTALCIILASLM